MRAGQSLQELSATLVAQKEKQQDYKVSTRALTMTAPRPGATLAPVPKLKFTVPEIQAEREFDLRPLCHMQLGQYVGVPKTYYDRMMADAPELLAANVNHWLQTSKEEERLIRTLGDDSRAFLSDRYLPLDNYDLAQAIMPVLSDPSVTIQSCALTETRLYIKAVSPKVEGEIRKGQPVQAGVVISNSEVGHGALSVQPMIMVLECLNGLIREDNRFRRIHLGSEINADVYGKIFRTETQKLRDQALFAELRDVADTCLTHSFFEGLLQDYREVADEPIGGGLPRTVENVTKAFSLSEDEGSDVLKFLAEGGDLTRWGLANAVSRTSQDLSDYDRATELEAIGTRVMDLSSRDWEAISGRN